MKLNITVLSFMLQNLLISRVLKLLKFFNGKGKLVKSLGMIYIIIIIILQNLVGIRLLHGMIVQSVTILAIHQGKILIFTNQTIYIKLLAAWLAAGNVVCLERYM